MAKKRSLIDPVTKYQYTLADGGNVLVEDPASGQRGLFAPDGQFIEGELNYANRQLLGWISRQHLVAKDND